MPKPNVLIALRTYANTEALDFGRRFITALCEEDARLIPELLSTSERFKDPFVDIDHFVRKWWAMPVKMYEDGRLVGERFAGPMWKRKSSLASRGKVNHGLVTVSDRKLRSSIWYQCRWSSKVDFEHLFDAWVELSQPEVGMLHLFTEPELRRKQSEAASSFENGSFGGRMKPGLPNIGWTMAYGRGYADEVDGARIKAAGFDVEERGGASLVRVTKSLSDVVDDFAYFSGRRAVLKGLFRPGLFWIQDEPHQTGGEQSNRSKA